MEGMYDPYHPPLTDHIKQDLIQTTHKQLMYFKEKLTMCGSSTIIRSGIDELYIQIFAGEHGSSILSCNVSFKDTSIIIKLKKIRDDSAQPNVLDNFRAEMEKVEHFEPPRLLMMTENPNFVTLEITPQCTNFSWIKENAHQLGKFAMLATWANDPELYHNLLEACKQPVMRPRQEMSDGSGAAGDQPSRVVRSRQEMSGGAGAAGDQPSRVVRPRQQMSDGSGAAGDQPIYPRLQEIIDSVYPAPAQKFIFRTAGKDPTPLRDGDEPLSNVEVKRYLNETNNFLFQDELSVDDAIKKFWELWKSDKEKFKDQKLIDIHRQRIDYLLAGINLRWEKDATQKKGIKLQVPRGNIGSLGKHVADLSLEQIIFDRILKEGRDYQVFRDDIAKTAYSLYLRVSNQYYDDKTKKNQELVVGFLHAIFNFENRALLRGDADFPPEILCTRVENGLKLAVSFPGHYMQFEALVTVEKALDVHFEYNFPLTDEQLSGLSNTIVLVLHREVPSYERIDLRLSAKDRKTSIKCYFFNGIETQLKIDMIRSILCTTIDVCLEQFLHASARVIEQI